MKLLWITPELPYPPFGGKNLRVYGLLEQLATRHRVSLIAFDRNPEDHAGLDKLKTICDDVVAVPVSRRQLSRHKRKGQLLSLFSGTSYLRRAYFSPRMQKTINDYVREHDFDVIQVESAPMGYYDIPGRAACVLDTHNVEYEIFHRTYRSSGMSLRKLYSLSEWYKFRRDELNICRKFALCLTTSERDRRILAADLPATRFAVIPNGVNTTVYASSPGDETMNGPSLLFTGKINYFPNTDGLRYFVEAIFPRVRQEIPGVRFYIVGQEPPLQIQRYRERPGIHVVGFVRDVRDYFRRSTLAVAPLRIGGGTRLKILEAMAMSRSVVATSMAAEGLDVIHGKHLLLADGPVPFATAVIELLKNTGLRRTLEKEGRKLVEERYDTRWIVQRLEATYEDLLRGRQRTDRWGASGAKPE